MTDDQWQDLWEDLQVDDNTLRQKVMNALPGMMNQNPDSTNQAVLEIIADEVVREVDRFRTIWKEYLLDNQSGTVLDATAADWGVSRIDNDDDFLRFQIRLAKMLNRIGVTEDDLIDLIAFILQADPTEFDVITDPEDLGGDPEAVRFTNIPNRYNKSARKKNLLIRALEKAVMPEVKIASVDFQAQADQSLFIATATTHAQLHYAVMDTMLNREHINGAATTIVATVTQKQRVHQVQKEG